MDLNGGVNCKLMDRWMNVLSERNQMPLLHLAKAGATCYVSLCMAVTYIAVSHDSVQSSYSDHQGYCF